MNTKTAAKKIAEESIVLLKNEEHMLPFSNGKKAALFGRAQLDTLYSGNGSGAAHTSGCRNILEACEEVGIFAEPGLKIFYQQMIEEENKNVNVELDWSNPQAMVNSGLMYEIFGRYHGPKAEFAIPDRLMQQADDYTDTAVLVMGRNSGGEECDRHLLGDYYLTDSEKALVDKICSYFENVILVLNINGLIDLSWIEKKHSIKSILFIGIPGEKGASALADILVGRVNPSGKLAVTIAKDYEDYPSWAHFSWDKDHSEKLLTYDSFGLDAADNGSYGFAKSPVTVYIEDIYAGYRYFDTFKKEPLFPFGYGLSYTDFQINTDDVVQVAGGISVKINVKNRGVTAGKEVVQVYLSPHTNKGERAYQELKGFEKTGLIKPQEQETLTVSVPWRELAGYDENRAAYVIGKGEYLLRIGNSSRNTEPVLCVTVEQDILVEQCTNCLGLQICNRGKLNFMSANQSWESEPYKWKMILTKEDIPKNEINRNLKTGIAEQRNEAIKEVIADEDETQAVCGLTVEQLAALCVGYGPGTPFSAFGGGSDPETIFDPKGNPVTTNNHPVGCNGYVSPAITDKGINSVFYKDGPAGIGEIAWPTEMLIACAFDRKLWYEFGNAAGTECERKQVDVWLAPAVNLHRHPLGGRNFEYFSEDPFLTGICACEVSKGVQENHPVLVCPKHFAVNEQETYRRGSEKKNYDAVDSIIQERTARELYLKPFEMLVKDAKISCLMTSFNKINGVFAGGNIDLCTNILRKEWGFEGVVITDWGDMDIVVDGADAVAAGNDVIMPGGPPVIAQILEGYKEGRVTGAAMKKSVRHLVLGVLTRSILKVK